MASDIASTSQRGTARVTRIPAADRSGDHRWRSRPVLGGLVRAVAVMAPAAAALAVSLTAIALVPPPPAAASRVVWWLVVSASSLLVMFGVQRLARRLLPLAALLKLSLVFPDQAPARYKLARQAGRPKDLDRLLTLAREGGRVGIDILGPQTVLELVAALSVHDSATRGHSERVRIFADLIAAEMKLPQHDQDRLRWAALLHDVGKLRVSRTILRKPATPTAVEWIVLKTHPAEGRRLIEPIAPWLGEWATAVEHHHERYDGTGYPNGLRAEGISLGGRIVAVADAYETMTAARPYKRPLSPSAARNQLVEFSGSQFDPAVVRAFLNISLGRLWRTIGVSAWVSQIPLLPQISTGVTSVSAQAMPMAAKGAVTLAVVAGTAVAAQAPTSAPAASATSAAAAQLATTGTAAGPAADGPVTTQHTGSQHGTRPKAAPAAKPAISPAPKPGPKAGPAPPPKPAPPLPKPAPHPGGPKA